MEWRVARWIVGTFGPTLSLTVLRWIDVPAWFPGKFWNNIRYAITIYKNYHFRQSLFFYYDRKIVPEKARISGPVIFSIRILLRVLRIRFLWNIASGTGHNTVELDYFFRLQMKTGFQNRVVFLRRPSVFHNDTLSLYRTRFLLASNNDFLCDFLFPVIAGSKKLIIDCGLSRLKWEIGKDGTFEEALPGQSYFFQIDKRDNIIQWQKYFEVRAETDGEYPLGKDIALDSELVDFIGGPPTKLALVHIKNHVANATAAPSNPFDYCTTIQWLLDQGFQVVQVGREPCPPSFRELGVIPYCESALATYKHDLQIFSLAKLAITAGSGIAFLPDCLGIPYVYLDSWHIGMPMISSRCVMVPALVVDRSTDKFLSFVDQIRLYHLLQDAGNEIFPSRDFYGRNAAPDEILGAVKEALVLENESVDLSPLQIQYRNLLFDGCLQMTKAKVSQGFLEKHSNLLLNRNNNGATI